MSAIATLTQNLRAVAGAALMTVALASCASSAGPQKSAATARDAAPGHFQRDPNASPDVFAIQWAEAQPTDGYARVAWHPLTGKEGAYIFVQQTAPRISGADIAATWVAVCASGDDDDNEPPKSGVIVQFKPDAEPRLAQLTRERMNRFLAVLAEGKVLSFARVEWDLPARLKICLDGASEEQATSLARVLAGKTPA
jgi:hypothetical protein